MDTTISDLRSALAAADAASAAFDAAHAAYVAAVLKHGPFASEGSDDHAAYVAADRAEREASRALYDARIEAQRWCRTGQTVVLRKGKHSVNRW